MTYKKNIPLDYLHTFFRNFNLANGLWMIYLKMKGFTYIHLAIFEAVFHISSLVFEIPTGVIADIFGRKASRLLGIFLYIVYVLLLITTDSFVITLLAFVICGLSYTLESGAGDALVYDSMKAEEIEGDYMKVQGRKEVIYQFTTFIALLFSGRIAEIDFRLAFLITAGFFIIAFIVVLFMREVPLELDHKTMKDLLKNQFVVSTKIVFNNKRLFMLIIIGAAMLAPITTMFFFIQNRLVELDFSLRWITIILGLHALMAAIGGFYTQKIEKKYGEKKILLFIPLFIVLLMWSMNSGVYIIIPFIMIGVFDSIFYVVLTDYINKMVESNIRATVLSFFGMAFSLVMIFIFMLVGIIGHLVSLQFAFMVLATIVSIFYIVLLPVLKGTKEIL